MVLILKYGFLALSLFLSIVTVWATASAEERKPSAIELRLIILTVLTGLVGIGLAVSEDVRDHGEAREQAVKEAKVTRDIIVSSQQLHSLELTWTFPEFPAELAEEISK